MEILTFKRLHKSLDEISEHLHTLREKVDESIVEEFIGELLSRKRIFIYGAGRSGLIGKCFAQRLMHIGFEAYFIGETTTPSVKPGDVVLIISGSGETATSKCLGVKAKDLKAYLVVVTAHKESTLGKVADLTLVVPGKTKLVERESYAPFTSLFDISVLALLDSVSSELMSRLGVGEDTILERHANLE